MAGWRRRRGWQQRGWWVVVVLVVLSPNLSTYVCPALPNDHGESVLAHLLDLAWGNRDIQPRPGIQHRPCRRW